LVTVHTAPRTRLVLVGNASRRSLELQLPVPALALLGLLSLVVVPTGAGAVLGTHHHQASLRAAAHLARLPHTQHAAPRAHGPRTAYRLVAPSAPLPLPTLPPAPPPQDVLSRELATPEQRRGHLRIHALHHGEYLDVVPHDARGVRNEEAFAALAHLFRCRITGHEVEIDERLVRLLTTLNDLYDKPLHLISGHRVAHTIQTSPTSQHTMGTAADVRVPGVPIEELREVARQLGARGLGLYTHKRFVHIDFRDKRRYFWTDLPERQQQQLASHHEAGDAAPHEPSDASGVHDHAPPRPTGADDGHAQVAGATRYEG
jgi:uncharacterized protein YcbK (DUF882 family)